MKKKKIALCLILSLLSINIYAQEERGKLSVSSDLGLWLIDSKANIYLAYQFKGSWYMEAGYTIDMEGRGRQESISIGNWLVKRDKGGLKMKLEVINQNQPSVDLRVGLSYQLYIFKGIFIDTGFTYPFIKEDKLKITIRIGWEF